MMKHYRSVFFGVCAILAAVSATAILTDSFLRPLTQEAFAQSPPVIFGANNPPAFPGNTPTVPIHWRLAVKNTQIGAITNEQGGPFIVFVPREGGGAGAAAYPSAPPPPGGMGIRTWPRSREFLAVDPTRLEASFQRSGMRIGPQVNDGSATLFVSGDRFVGDQRVLLVRAGVLNPAENIFSVEGFDFGCGPGGGCEQWLNVGAHGKVGINVNGAREQLHVNGNVFVEGASSGVQNGVILRSGSGACWKINVSDTGAVGSVPVVPCP